MTTAAKTASSDDAAAQDPPAGRRAVWRGRPSDEPVAGSTVARQLWTLVTLSRGRFFVLVRETLALWQGRGAARLAAALAFYLLFSAAPLLVLLLAVVGFVLGDDAARGEIAPRLGRLIGPEGAEAVELMIWRASVPWSGGTATVAGLATVFFSASAAVSELRSALNTLWSLETDSRQDVGLLRDIGALLRDRLFAFLTVIGAGFLVALSFVLLSVVAFFGTRIAASLHLPALSLQVANLVVFWAASTTTVALVYVRLPDARISRGDAVTGAAVTALLFGIGNALVSQILAVAAASPPYGPAGSLLALLTWVYCSTLVFLLGAAFTAVFAQRCGSGIVPQRRWVRVPMPRRRGRRSPPPGIPLAGTSVAQDSVAHDSVGQDSVGQDSVGQDSVAQGSASQDEGERKTTVEQRARQR